MSNSTANGAEAPVGSDPLAFAFDVDGGHTRTHFAGKRVYQDLGHNFRIADLSELDSFNTALPLICMLWDPQCAVRHD